MTRIVEVDDVEYRVEISYKFYGKYRRATLENPEEYPECHWKVDEVYRDGRIVTDEKTIKVVNDALEEIAEQISYECEDDAVGYRD